MSKLDLTKINYDRFVTTTYKGMEFTYKKWLTLGEQRAFIDVVLDGSINGDEYSDVLREYTARVTFLTFYTDIDLMEVSESESFIYGGLYKDIFYMIIKDIDSLAYEAMIREIDNTIDRYNSSLAVAIREMKKELDAVDIEAMMASVLQSIENPEVMKLIKGEMNG